MPITHERLSTIIQAGKEIAQTYRITCIQIQDTLQAIAQGMDYKEGLNSLSLLCLDYELRIIRQEALLDREIWFNERTKVARERAKRYMARRRGYSHEFKAGQAGLDAPMTQAEYESVTPKPRLASPKPKKGEHVIEERGEAYQREIDILQGKVADTGPDYSLAFGKKKGPE